MIEKIVNGGKVGFWDDKFAVLIENFACMGCWVSVSLVFLLRLVLPLVGHRLGDPCEFGLVGLLSTCDTQSVEERIGAQTARDCRLALGLTMTFSWLAAQAANQGR